jgi:hypothetical protein
MITMVGAEAGSLNVDQRPATGSERSRRDLIGGCYPKTLLRRPVEGAAPSAPLGHLAATARRPPSSDGFRKTSNRRSTIDGWLLYSRSA